MQVHYDPVYTDADFRPETLQVVAADDGLPMWATAPGDLVGTLKIQCDGRYTVLTQKSDDGSGAVTIRDDGFVDLYLDASKMASFRQGMHTLHLTLATDGYTAHVLTGALPIYEVV